MIQEYTKILDRGSSKLADTASTGAASLQVGGYTMHLVAGVGVGVVYLADCVAVAMKIREARSNGSMPRFL